MLLVGINLGNFSCRLIEGTKRPYKLAKAHVAPEGMFADGQFFRFSTMRLINRASQIMCLLGRKFSDPELQSELGFLPFRVIEGPQGYPLIYGLRGDRAFTPVEVLAMLISQLMNEKYPYLFWDKNDPLHDYTSFCIAVPSYFKDQHKEDVRRAAVIAGLKSFTLMDETTAMVMAYPRSWSFQSLGNVSNVVFIDIGHTSIQVCFAEVKGHINIVYKAYMRSLGGRHFDKVLFKHFSSMILEKYDIDVYESAHDCISLLDACESLKKDLSKYDEAFYCIEFMNREDVKGSMKREFFEILSAPILKKIKAALENALRNSGLNMNEPLSVEAVGNGCSVPAIINILREVFKTEPRKMTCSDEYVVRGCADKLVEERYFLVLDHTVYLKTTSVPNLESVSSELPFEGKKAEDLEKRLWIRAMGKQRHSLISLNHNLNKIYGQKIAIIDNAETTSSFWKFWHGRDKLEQRKPYVDRLEEETPKLPCPFSYLELQDATDNFHESYILGHGGFGIVYKGILHKTTVAIKMLKDGSSQGTEEYNTEVEILRKERHENIVKLIGLCAETQALIYEYLPNGSLEDRLKCKNNIPPLSWQSRVRIASEICSALDSLHRSKPHGIAHGDLKPDNILLGINNVSKISDFGLSRQLNWTDGDSVPYYITDCPKGTLAYMDPEYLSTGMLTPQYDIYAFGIILLRMVTCKNARGIRNLVEEAQKKGQVKTLVDSSAGQWPFEEAMKMISLGLRCSHPMRNQRPNLSTEVSSEIESMVDVASTSSVPSLFSWLVCRH